MNKPYLTPCVSDLTQAPRSIGLLQEFAPLSAVNALIDRKQVFNTIGESQALELFELVRRIVPESIVEN